MPGNDGVQAPVTFKLGQPTGQPGYVVTVHNKNWFTSTAGLVFDFRLLADGVPIKQEADQGWTPFDIAQIPPQVLYRLAKCNLPLCARLWPLLMFAGMLVHKLPLQVLNCMRFMHTSRAAQVSLCFIVLHSALSMLPLSRVFTATKM